MTEFRRLFGEDWQQSQFWYSENFAYSFARSLRQRIPNSDCNVVFISCPTAYVAFQHALSQDGQPTRENTWLFEIDDRFSKVAGDSFVRFNLFKEASSQIPASLKGQVDLVVIDPPFLNRDTNEGVSNTLRWLLKSDAQVVLLTSTQVQDLVEGPEGIYKDCGRSYLCAFDDELQ